MGLLPSLVHSQGSVGLLGECKAATSWKSCPNDMSLVFGLPFAYNSISMSLQFLGKSFLGRGNGQCNGSKAGVYLEQLGSW